MADTHIPRWEVTLVYRSEAGPVDVTHEVEELDEIADLAERGPSWEALLHGTFRLNPRLGCAGLTVEETRP